ncbi:hypothetical protein [Phytopseudomonas dryadis]|uniref:Uncharacterized protein n=1 Tax=Phytopseudomonas dryadis TaxID=2487520 RepID=A0A4Q9RA06_9GAMM|nr:MULTISPECIES: hypothetical protein [Pseudomonas]TBU97560.1 hypothetical protein DNK44_00820 [Pseudomonas dryadis]TBV10015.1 hypothetical protein DNK34_00830 [Pseudomonas dryadis]TBV19156.1 hypothetical protein DNK41_05415 [Pseudomonas sp. FRB 230]
MDGGKFDNYDLERYHSLLADELGLSVDELETWMEDETERVDDAGRLIGHAVTFKPSMPFDLRARVRGMAGEYTAHTGVIRLDS